MIPHSSCSDHSQHQPICRPQVGYPTVTFAPDITFHRIDIHSVIKVADFGLSESMYSKTYFRQEKNQSVKLPVKWLSPEALTEGVFSEKSDVVSYASLVARPSHCPVVDCLHTISNQKLDGGKDYLE